MKFTSIALTLLATMVASTSLMAADIVDTAVNAGSFKTLVTAVKSAGLVETLQSAGPFTVLAPTDEAFSKLPEGTIPSLLKPENKDKLTSILTYHVVPGAVMAEDVVKLSGAKTVNGQQVNIQVANGTVMIDGAKVVTTDIKCDNGIIHVIDAVILPADKTIPETAKFAGKFNTLLAAVTEAGLAETLGTKGPFTVFAPTDAAFEKLPEGTVANLLKPENKEQLVNILKYHVVSGRVYSEDALAAKSAETLLGKSISISADDQGAMVNDAKLVATDLDAFNGVIHVIDAVLLPPKETVDARGMIRNAIAEGAHLYNSGHHQACAELYSDTYHKLMSTEVSEKLKGHMKTVMSQAAHTNCSTQRAWTLRRGMDQMYAQLAQ